ncbi:hypothetical protein ACFQZ4_51550 [Catellatospora coxensis]
MNPGTWERRLYRRAHPFAYPLLRLLARRGPVVRVPGLGVVVNDAALARQVLLDGETFRKDGPGSSGDLWTPILGPSVLLNMEGPAHRALRARLAELFTPATPTGSARRSWPSRWRHCPGGSAAANPWTWSTPCG